MLCDECGKRPAKVHITKIINNNKTKLDLCEECANKYQKQHSFSFGIEPAFSIHNFLAGLLDDDFDMGQGVTIPAAADLRCGKCGLTFREFSKVGRLGCDRCYEIFRHKIEPLLARIHGNSVHAGKIPKHMGENIRYKKEIEDLRNELQSLVAEERFEEAAEVRDRIRDLEAKLKG